MQADSAAIPSADEAVASFGPGRFLNRELSWLAFNRRVLELAEDPRLPLLERVKFVAIFSSNLDEFFQVRVAGLHEQIEAKVPLVSPDGRTAMQQCAEIHALTRSMVARQQAVFQKELLPELAAQGIRILNWQQLDAADRVQLREMFQERIEPVLTPLLVDRAHPFPIISNLSLNLGVVLHDPQTGVDAFARLKVPGILPRFYELPDGQRWVPIEQVIGAHLEVLFPGMEIVAHYPFRVTLNGDLELDEGEADDLLEAVVSGLHRRLRMNAPARLEVDAEMSSDVRELLTRELELMDQSVYENAELLDLTGLWQLYALDRPELKDPRWVPVTPPELRREESGGSESLFAALRAADTLVQHPYDSFEGSVEEFIWQAARDPAVLAIKHTLYRTSGTDNPVLQALGDAARSGKEVVVLVELQARFDEQANIQRARILEQAGAHVVYGIVGLKTHAKIAMVVRREGGGIRRYCHIGTGNYNPSTARLYEDLGMFTVSPEIGSDVAALFNYLTGFARAPLYQKLLVAPHRLRARLLELIAREMACDDGQIVMKMNSLSDPRIIDALYGASRAGVDIDLIVRGICCLRPGMLGLSETVRVRSILGRYLEHSRIMRFGSERRGYDYFIGSADMMTRNLDLRVEAVAPVEDPRLAVRIEEILQVALAEDTSAWELDQDGTWTPRGHVNSQERLQALALERGR